MELVLSVAERGRERKRQYDDKNEVGINWLFSWIRSKLELDLQDEFDADIFSESEGVSSQGSFDDFSSSDSEISIAEIRKQSCYTTKTKETFLGK
eukprot:14381864-Ditylum_brightwellii.AAC.1